MIVVIPLMLPLHDTGLSAGRNRLVEACKTPYCVIIDDDCIFNENTNLEAVLNELKERNLDLLQFKIVDVAGANSYRGLYEITEDTIAIKDGTKEDGLYDYIANIFMAKTDTLRKYRWHEELKLGEHEAYFRRYYGKMRIGYTEVGEIEHKHGNETSEYGSMRKRAVQYLRDGLIADGFKYKIYKDGTKAEI
jgi:glycosyltransferase involved in cell wall biosynthesis